MPSLNAKALEAAVEAGIKAMPKDAFFLIYESDMRVILEASFTAYLSALPQAGTVSEEMVATACQVYADAACRNPVEAGIRAVLALSLRQQEEAVPVGLHQWIAEGIKDADRKLGEIVYSASTYADQLEGRIAAYQGGFQQGVKSTLTDAAFVVARSPVPADAGEPTHALPDIFDWLETELSAIDCWYRGDPSYEHDAYWFKDKALALVKQARVAFPIRSTVPTTSQAKGSGWLDISSAPKVHGETILSTNRHGVVDVLCWNDAIGGWDDGFWDEIGDENAKPVFPRVWQPVPALDAPARSKAKEG